MNALKVLYNKEQGSMFEKDELFITLHDLIESGNAIYIPGQVASLKNSKQIFQMNTGKSVCCAAPYIKEAVRKYRCTKCNVVSSILGKRPVLVPSATHKKYKENSTGAYIQNKQKFRKLLKNSKKPYLLGLYFIRTTKGTFDYDNSYSTVADLMRDNKYIDDDSAYDVKPVFLGHIVDREAAGVIITILKDIKYEFNVDFKSSDTASVSDPDAGIDLI